MAAKDILDKLYPFLNEQTAPSARLEDELLESVRRKAADSVAAKQSFFAAQADQVVAAAKAISEVYRRDGRLFTMGNGGSSCDAAHIAVEFLHPVTVGRPALPAVNLDEYEIDAEVIKLVNKDVCMKHGVVPVSRSGSSLIVAMSDPTNLHAIDDIKFLTGYNVEALRGRLKVSSSPSTGTTVSAELPL